VGRVRYTPRAEQDLREIWNHVASDNQPAADRLLMRIIEKLDRASNSPQIGSPRPELSPTARILVEGRYVLIYEPQTDGVLAVAIVHGMRDPKHWLD